MNVVEENIRLRRLLKSARRVLGACVREHRVPYSAKPEDQYAEIRDAMALRKKITAALSLAEPNSTDHAEGRADG